MWTSGAAPATVESWRLNAKAKGPFKVRAVSPNDRYEVEDLRDEENAWRRTVVAVGQLCPGIIFGDSAQYWVNVALRIFSGLVREGVIRDGLTQYEPVKVRKMRHRWTRAFLNNKEQAEVLQGVWRTFSIDGSLLDVEVTNRRY